MKDYIDQLVRSLLQKQSLEECSLKELEDLASDHPYFGAAQLLLAKKLQKESSPGYAAQVEKTSLFFNNPFWLDQLLNEKGDAASEIKIKTEIEEDEKEEVVVMDKVEENGRLNNGMLDEDFTNDRIEDIESKIETEPESLPTDIGTKLESLPESESEPELQPISESQPESVDIPTMPEPEPEPQPQLQPLFRKEESFKSTDFVFEPYHTVDYFASQGIRFKEEEKPADKFGQQLKSFTEWLKTLKRLPVTEIVKHSSPALEQKVEQMAEASLTEGEVITEAMAEVWAKQGNTEKANAIYEKLSLLEPSKRAYFAAKIEDLKR